MRYHNITKDDMLNGDGLRVVLWVAGCSHGCRECQNPITWDPNGGLPFDQAAKQELFDQLEKSYISGVTFSGGDPLYPGNRMEITALAKEIREKFPEKTIWCYSGYTLETDILAGRLGPKDITMELLGQLDVLVDGEFHLEEKDPSLRFRGSRNQRIIDVKKTLETGETVLWDGRKEP